MQARSAQASRRFRRWVIGVLVVAGLWRLVMAAALPSISRDGVVFCWYARALGTQGPAYVQAPEAHQHPLFPALILVVQRAARMLGAPDCPLTWQRSGQFVCWVAGMAVVVLAGALAHRLVRRLALPLDAHVTVVGAMALAALLDLNVWLSADVMSDSVHLALYLGAVYLLLQLNGVAVAAGCGALAGLAFLTRQEGLLPVVAGLVVLGGRWGHVLAGRLVARAIALLLAFGIFAGPYWLAVGSFSKKKDPLDLLGHEVALANQGRGQACDEPPAFTLAKLETVDLPWYAVVPHALYKLLRAGRVVVPLLALLPLLNLRTRLLHPPLVGLTVCVVGHFALMVLLLDRYGYLATRHTLVVVMLLVPFAAMLLGRLLLLARQQRLRWLTVGVIAVCFVPLAYYARRVPNGPDRFLVAAATWLTNHDADLASKTLLGGSSTRRIAFYAGMNWAHWPEDPGAYDALCAQLRGLGPGYFAIELEPARPQDDQFERAGNRALVDRLLEDVHIAPHLETVHTQPAPGGAELRLFRTIPDIQP